MKTFTQLPPLSPLLCFALLATGCQGESVDSSAPGQGQRPGVGGQPGADMGDEAAFPDGSVPDAAAEPVIPELDLPGTATCRPPWRSHWQLTPKQLVQTFRHLWPKGPEPQFGQFEAKLVLYATADEPYTSTPALSLSTPAFSTEVIALASMVAQGMLKEKGGVPGLPPCASEDAPDLSCAKETLQSFGARAWRRPLTPEEVSTWSEAFAARAAQASAKEAMHILLRRVLAHPEVLLRQGAGELPPMAEAPIAATLTPFELADFIAYTLTDGPPDEALAGVAEDGTLSDPEVREAQVRRLLDRAPEAEVIVAQDLGAPQKVTGILRFFREWLDVEDIRFQERPNLGKHEGLSEERALRWMDNEAMLFLRHVLWEGDARLKTLLSADYTTYQGSRSIARYYMGEDAAKSPPAGVAPTTDGRLGMLMQGGFLISHQSATSRGLFIRSRLFCQDIHAPVSDDIDMNLAGLEEMLEAQGGDLSAREVRAVHMKDPACSGCHASIDPLGFPFDHFDTNGLYREDWDGFPIDTAGEVLHTKASDTQVDGPQSLVLALSESADVRACFVRQLYTWVHGRTPGQEDTCYLEGHIASFEASGGDIRELLVGMMTGPEATTRTPYWIPKASTP